MKKLLAALAAMACFAITAPAAHAAPCMIVTLTGTQGGPQAFQGISGPGTLVRYGDDTNNCNAVRLQFDAGRGTTLQLSKLGIAPMALNAVFFTHMHSDHSEGFIDLAQLRWHLGSRGPKIDVVCSADAASPLGHSLSCKKFVEHIGDALIQSGEMAQRLAEDKTRLPGGPAELANVMTFQPSNQPQAVWSSGDVKVSAIRSTHIPGHASYRVDTPAGSVVIGGDAGNDKFAPPRPSSTSEQVELLAKDADIVVHSAIHPVMGPDKDSGVPPPIFLRQSTASDLGAMAQRAGVKHLMLTHLFPPTGTDRHGLWKVPGGALTEDAWRKPVQDSGFTGNTVVGQDLASIRLPPK